VTGGDSPPRRDSPFPSFADDVANADREIRHGQENPADDAVVMTPELGHDKIRARAEKRPTLVGGRSAESENQMISAVCRLAAVLDFSDFAGCDGFPAS
jgi:hypothetical protein